MKNDLHVGLTIRLFTDRKAFGPGVAELLRRVRETHSLRAAALDMEMAYSKAWTIMKNAERGLGVKLLSSSTGGKHGGGAALTEEGRRILTAYDSYCRKLRAYGQELLAEEFSFYGEWQ